MNNILEFHIGDRVQRKSDGQVFIVSNVYGFNHNGNDTWLTLKGYTGYYNPNGFIKI